MYLLDQNGEIIFTEDKDVSSPSQDQAGLNSKSPVPQLFCCEAPTPTFPQLNISLLLFI